MECEDMFTEKDIIATLTHYKLLKEPFTQLSNAL